MTYKKLIIIGAPRSGTNMLRDALTSVSGVCTWPCDEINYIWRHYNVRYPTDEIPADHAGRHVIHYVRGKFDKLARRCGAEVVVEKTCANSLRVPFVSRIVPDARYVFIVRDGLDVIGSAASRWTADLDLPYVLQKARFVPWTDMPYYASRYLVNRLRKLKSSGRQMAAWGPVSTDLLDEAVHEDLLALCARQWRACVETADRDLAGKQVVRVKYEDFVSEPESALREILHSVGVEAVEQELELAVSGISKSSVGRGRRSIPDAERLRLRPIIGDTLVRFGYGL